MNHKDEADRIVDELIKGFEKRLNITTNDHHFVVQIVHLATVKKMAMPRSGFKELLYHLVFEILKLVHVREPWRMEKPREPGPMYPGTPKDTWGSSAPKPPKGESWSSFAEAMIKAEVEKRVAAELKQIDARIDAAIERKKREPEYYGWPPPSGHVHMDMPMTEQSVHDALFPNKKRKRKP